MRKNRLRLSEEIRYLDKWVPIAVLVGITAGIGAIAFTFAIEQCTILFLAKGAGYVPPSPAGEGGMSFIFPRYSFLIPVITTLGGLLSGIIVYKLAPEAEGHGTDAAIDAFHNKNGEISPKVPVIKLIASAITIGSGGSAGREGPSAQIGAGFGSMIGKAMHLRPHERGIAMAIGIGAGIGAIFKAPFGGAVLAAEILYISDFEIAVLPPALISSTVAYSIYGSVMGWTPIFGIQNQYMSNDPIWFPLYAFLGLICGIVAIGYIRSFYGVKDLFKRLQIPNYVKPAIGGLAVGLIGMALPQVLGMGYGWLQMAIDGEFITLTFGIIIALIVLKILATSLTVGSGGSGGVFAPALFIGGMIGAAFWMICHSLIPNFGVASAPFVIVGMMAFFGAAGKAPLAVILMVSEMTGSYTLLVPAMIATSIAYIISGKNTIYRSQVPTKADSPAHRGEYSVEVLRGMKVKNAMTKDVISITPTTSVDSALDIMNKNGIKGIPVVDENNRVLGMITYEDILEVPEEERKTRMIGEVMTRRVICCLPDDNLGSVLEKMFKSNIGRLPVIESNETKRLIGIITREDIGRAYHASVEELIGKEE
ncbi:MAG: chloride channel protein [Methanomassiliicoccales archaeon]|nr:chloride channel protein [Methanomassiliicoccales archaeon]